MKRYLAFLMTMLLLTSSAQAESIRSQVGAPEHAEGRWTTATGKTVVTVDATVIVPDVEAIHTYAIASRDVTAADARAMASAAAPETDWERDWLRMTNTNQRWTGPRDEFLIDGSDKYYFRNVNFQWYPFFDGSADYSPYKKGHPELQEEYGWVDAYNYFGRTAFGDQRLISRVQYEYFFGHNHPFFYYDAHSASALRESGQLALPGQTLTWDEAQAMAESFAAQVDGDLVLFCCGAARGEIVHYNAKTKKSRQEDADRNAYWFCFTRAVDGIPGTYTHLSLSYKSELGYTVSPDYETLTLAIDGERIVGAKWNAPWVVGERQMTDVTLMPFDDILSIFGAVCPLSIQAQENAYQTMGGSGNSWMIHEIRLGYMPVLRRDESGVWELRPVWDFFGVHRWATQVEDRPYQVALTIDAIDGTVIDRKYGY